MNARARALQKRLYIAAGLILVLGISAAVLIHALAADAAPDAVGYIVVDGVVQPIAPGDSKAYTREIERFGGKGALLLDEFGRWFAGWWRGKALAATVAWISVGLAVAVAAFAYDMPNHPGTRD